MPIKHRHQSTLPSVGADVDVAQWNDAHVLDGGTQGQVLQRDTTNADGWTWSSNVSAAVPTNPFVLTGGQISFPATQIPSSNPNVLDDYEEGTFQPFLTTDGTASGQTYASRSGFYTKIGRQVTAHYDLTLSLKGSMTGNVLLSGFPALGGTASVGVGWFPIVWHATATAFVALYAYPFYSSTSGYVQTNLYQVTAATTSAMGIFMAPASLNDTSRFGGTIIYFVS